MSPREPDGGQDQDQEPLDALLESADAARASGGQAVREDDFQIIRFRTGGRDFAFEIDAVERTERVPMVTPVPRSPSYIRGVATLRGGVVCVLDLRHLLSGEQGTSPTDAKSLLVVCDGGERRLGLLSESLPDFQRVRGGETMAVPGAELDLYVGTIERDGQLVGVLDPGKLFDLIERRMAAS